MSFKPKYIEVKVNSTSKASKIYRKAPVDRPFYLEDLVEAAQEAFAAHGGLKKRPTSRKWKRPIKITASDT